jgi:hydroxymethylbilane synthase
MTRRIVVGSRASKLALFQTESVVERLRCLDREADISISKITTQGDRSPQVRLEQVEGTGFFVRELEEALLDHRIDLAVHSLKDVPSELPEGLILAAVPERADPRDVLVSRKQRLAELPRAARVGTGSLRRSLQLSALRHDLLPTSIRGNVDTRVGKVDSGDYDALVTAAAALIRLGLEGRIVEYFNTESFLPAVGQGALVIESRRDDDQLMELLSKTNDLPSWQSVSAERALLFALGGGCQAPIAALASVDDGILRIDGLVASVRQTKVLRDQEVGAAVDAVEIGQSLARRLLEMGGGDFIEEAKHR